MQCVYVCIWIFFGTRTNSSFYQCLCMQTEIMQFESVATKNHTILYMCITSYNFFFVSLLTIRTKEAWRLHQLLSGFLLNGHLLRVSNQHLFHTKKVTMRWNRRLGSDLLASFLMAWREKRNLLVRSPPKCCATNHHLNFLRVIRMHSFYNSSRVCWFLG